MSGFLTKLDVTVITPFNPPSAREAVCGCDFSACYTEKVFADTEATGDYWKADKTSFLFRKQIASDTVVFELYKKGRLVASISGSSYGDYYASFTDTNLQTGWIADWTSIFNAFGGGIYNVNINYTTLGTNYNIESSRKFHLMPYRPELAHGTVRIETYQTGNIIGSNVDYSLVLSDLPRGWYNSIRVDGRFYASNYTLERNEYFNSNYRLTQNNNEVKNEYSLETKIIPDLLNAEITQGEILANEVLVTNYDLYDSRIFRRKDVVPSSFSEVNQIQQQGGTNFIITFEDRTQNTRKRNF